MPGPGLISGWSGRDGLALVEKRRHRTRSMSRKREREFPGHSRELLPGRSDLPRGKQTMSVGGG